MRQPPRTMLLLALAATLAGCAAHPASPQAQDPEPPYPPPGPYDVSGLVSRPLAPPRFQSFVREVQSIPSFDSVRLQLHVARPDAPGRFPVILQANPYLPDFQVESPSRWMQPHRDAFLEQGFAFVTLAVRGTGGSGGCPDFGGRNEVRDLDRVLTWVGTQAWSNGNVGMYGLSYMGISQWMAAATGNPHLKTIVPAASFASLPHAVFRNASWDTPGAATTWTNYHLLYPHLDATLAAIQWGGGPTTRYVRSADRTAEGLCPGLLGVTDLVSASLTGDPRNAYLADRDYEARILERYNGSVLVIHSFDDWLPMYALFPFVNRLDDGRRTFKMILARSYHGFPDAVPPDSPSMRWDLAELLVRWYRHHLEGPTNATLGPPVEVLDSRGFWRAEPEWPPVANWTAYNWNATGRLMTTPDATTARVRVGARASVGHPTGPDNVVTQCAACPYATTPLLTQHLRVSGMPQLHATFVPATAEAVVEAHLYAYRADVPPRLLATSVMDARYAGGGRVPGPVTSGQPTLFRMEFSPLDEMLRPGTGLLVAAFQRTAAGANIDPRALGPVELETGGTRTTLRIPVIEPPASAFFEPPRDGP